MSLREREGQFEEREKQSSSVFSEENMNKEGQQRCVGTEVETTRHDIIY